MPRLNVNDASDLYSEQDNGFKCTNCSKNLYLKILRSDKNIVTGKCHECEAIFNINLPKLTKKLIYLDQWFISNLHDEKRKATFEKLIEKIEKLKSQQKVAIIVSNIHVTETANIPRKDKQISIWEKFNSLADGEITKDWQDIFVSQAKRQLSGEVEKYPWNDILDYCPHDWTIGQYIGSGVHARVLLTNSWMLGFHQKYTASSDKLNEGFLKILQKQCKEIDPDSTVDDCYNYIKNIWIEDIESAIEYSFNIQELLKGNFEGLENLPSLEQPPFYPTISKVVSSKLDYSSKEFSEDKVLKYFTTTDCLPKQMNIEMAFEAKRLFSALQAINQSGDITQNLKRFSRKYGVSSVNDSSHISSFAPYVDFFITDDSARESLSAPPVEEHFTDLNCHIFSNNNICEFDGFLDNLLDENNEEEILLTLKLIHSVGLRQREMILRKVCEETIAKFGLNKDKK